METTVLSGPAATTSKPMLITGRVVSGLCITFLLVDAVMKVIKNHYSIEGSIALGWPADAVQAIGIALLISTILYAVPRTAMLGAILLTGYLGGAIAIMVRAGQPLYFAAVFGILVWAGLYLRNSMVRAMSAMQVPW